jgi:hypothetical protein
MRDQRECIGEVATRHGLKIIYLLSQTLTYRLLSREMPLNTQ